MAFVDYEMMKSQEFAKESIIGLLVCRELFDSTLYLFCSRLIGLLDLGDRAKVASIPVYFPF